MKRSNAPQHAVQWFRRVHEGLMRRLHRGITPGSRVQLGERPPDLPLDCLEQLAVTLGSEVDTVVKILVGQARVTGPHDGVDVDHFH